MTDDTVHEFEASLDLDFPETETLTLYLTVGNPPYNTVPDIGSSTPPEETNTGDGDPPPEETNTGDDTPPEETNTGDDTPPEETNTGDDTPPAHLLRRPRTITAATRITTVVARSRRTTAAVAVAEASATVR